MAKNKRYTSILVGFTQEQLDFLDSHSAYGRGEILRYLLNQHMEQKKIRVDEEEKCFRNYATWEDFEKVFDAYRDDYLWRLEAAASNGHNIDQIVEDFRFDLNTETKLMTYEAQVRAFLTEKLEEVSNTN